MLEGCKYAGISGQCARMAWIAKNGLDCNLTREQESIKVADHQAVGDKSLLAQASAAS